MSLNSNKHIPAQVTQHHRYVCSGCPHEVLLTPHEHFLGHERGAPTFICSACYDEKGIRHVMDYLGVVEKED